MGHHAEVFLYKELQAWMLAMILNSSIQFLYMAAMAPLLRLPGFTGWYFFAQAPPDALVLIPPNWSFDWFACMVALCPPHA